MSAAAGPHMCGPAARRMRRAGIDPRISNSEQMPTGSSPALSREAIERYEARILAYERQGAPEPRRQRPAAPRPPRRRRRSVPARARLRRVVLLTALLLLLIASSSFALTMLQASNVGFGVRFVEWLRDNGAAGLVSEVESIYYSLNAPAKGGPTLKRLPTVGRTTGGVARAASDAPAPIPPAIAPALPAEGRWQSTGPIVNGAAPVLVTTFRPDPNYPRVLAGVAWIDTSRSSLALYPGRYEPPSASGSAAEVPLALRPRLLADFNSGFKLEDSGGGFVASGRVYAPLKDGQATLIGYSNGTVDLRAWTGGADPGPGVAFARQNLPLIVTGGRLNPALSDDSLWGATLGNAVRVWRSGVGIDAHGNLLYAAADLQTASSLARILQRAGAVRAMELDINYEWVTFNFFGALGAQQPAKLLPAMNRNASRYLTPDDRDFFAVYAR